MTAVFNTLVGLGTRVNLSALTLSSVVPNTENALCVLEFLTTGSLRTTEGSGGGVVQHRLPQWWGKNYLCGFDIAAPYEIRLTVSSGDSPTSGSASVNTWIEMGGAAVEWRLSRTTTGTLSGVWLIEIRSGSTVLASASYTVTSTKNA